MEFAIKLSDCLEMKNKHIDRTLCLKCDHRVWPWPWPSRSNMEYAISQPKMVRLRQNEKQTYRLNTRPQIWPSSWIFKVKYGICYICPIQHRVSVFLWTSTNDWLPMPSCLAKWNKASGARCSTSCHVDDSLLIRGGSEHFCFLGMTCQEKINCIDRTWQQMVFFFLTQ